MSFNLGASSFFAAVLGCVCVWSDCLSEYGSIGSKQLQRRKGKWWKRKKEKEREENGHDISCWWHGIMIVEHWSR